MPKTLLTWILILASAVWVRAAHLVGGEIFYECLGGDQYQITLKVYRDCYTVTGAPYDNPANIAVYDNSGNLVVNLTAPFTGSQQLPVIINNPCLQAPPDVCVEEAIYTVTTTLPYIAGGYHVAYQRCCRNPTIVNLVNPEDLGSTYYVQIPETALNSCNSSPYFNGFPPIALCTGDQLVFDHSATDPEGDQLVYSLCTPFHGGDQIDPQPIPPLGPPYSSIIWGGGYSSSYPLNSSPQLTIDPQTGLLTGVPTQVGQFVVGVCVEEYRNGQLLSINKRDFQFNVVSCTSNIQAVIPPQPTFHDPCNGLTVDFGNNSVNAQFYHWDFGVAGTFSDTAFAEDPVFTYPDTGVYSVTLVANPGYPCADTTIDDILVYNDVSVDILSSGEQCFDANSIDFSAVGDFGSGATFYWEFQNGTPSTSTEMNPQGVVFDTVGTYDVSVQVTEAVCTDEAISTIEMYPRPQAFFNADNLQGCAPLGVFLLDSSLAYTPHQSQWDMGDGTELTGSRVLHAYQTPGTYDITLTIWTETGCVDTSVFQIPNAIEVLPLPTASLGVDTNFKYVYDPVFTFTGTSNAVSCELFPGDGTTVSDSIPNCTFEHFYSDTGNYQAVIVFTDDNGCVSSDSIWVRVEPEVRFWVPNAFTPNGDRINDTWGPKAFGMSEYEIWVYDRWGNLMFHSEDPFEKWDGSKDNKGNHDPVNGVYAYRILARSVKSTYIKEFGHVTILK
ncbi:MAG: gliding motility-associated C-terminal domain-containing protein [Flavobacteriales bacterium]|nr:gliding motility-associated C-terminal domain-containing protein [Flavobacteriales bacterium]